MKKTFAPLVFSSITIIFGCDFASHNEHQSITIINNSTKYNFKAEFPIRKTAKIFKYIGAELGNDQLFQGDGRQDAEVILGDTLQFHLESEPGFISIKFDKKDNSYSGYERMQKLCSGLRGEMK